MADGAPRESPEPDILLCQNTLLNDLLQTNRKLCATLETLRDEIRAIRSPAPNSQKSTDVATISDDHSHPLAPRVLDQTDFKSRDSAGSRDAVFSDADLRHHINCHDWGVAARRAMIPVLDSVPIKDPHFLSDPRFNALHDPALPPSIYLTLRGGGVLYKTRPSTLPAPACTPYSWRESLREIWDDLRDTDTRHARWREEKPLHGRMVVLREPGPLKLMCLHLAMRTHFNMDEIYHGLFSPTATRGYIQPTWDLPHYLQDSRHFVFYFHYFTVVAPGCKPGPWADFNGYYSDDSPIALSSCSSVVALSLAGDVVNHVQKITGGKLRKYPVYDHFAPWQAIVIQFFPDRQTTADVFGSRRVILSGPEAFLRALLAQYQDAHARLQIVTAEITRITTLGVSALEPPPAQFDQLDFRPPHPD